MTKNGYYYQTRSEYRGDKFKFKNPGVSIAEINYNCLRARKNTLVNNDDI